MNKNLKRGALLAASAATVFSLTLAAPSFAHDGKAKGPRAGSSNSADENRPAKPAHTHASVAVSITAIPSTVTNVGQIIRGAQFVAYPLAADATAVPAAKPTTGGKPAKVEAKVSATNTLSYELRIGAPATAGVAKFAVYNSAGVATLVTVTTDSAGVATATSSAALTTAYAEPTKPAMGEGKGMKNDRKHDGRMKMGRGPMAPKI
jgi:hypothetical protein